MAGRPVRQTLLRRRGSAQITALKIDFEVESYGALPIDPERYPLFVVKTRNTATAESCIEAQVAAITGSSMMLALERY